VNRLEIIMDQTIEDIFLENLGQELPGTPFTLIRNALGNGASGPRMGTPVWPEENSFFIIYTGAEETAVVSSILLEMRKCHPDNGIAAFISPQAEELFQTP
jgi:hypothetical protein